MKKFFYYLPVVLATALVFCNCSGEKHTGPTMTLITDQGGVNDQSFNQGAWEGLVAFNKDYPATRVNYFECKSPTDYLPFIQNAVDDGSALMLAMGFQMGEFIKQASELYPDKKFAIVDFEYDPPLPNVAAIHSRVEEGTYLAGYLAAKMSKTKKIGFIGGMAVPIIEQFKYGYLAGAYAADPSVQVFVQYTVSFSDADKGKAVAQSMADSGADVLFAAAGDTGTGVIELARERNLLVIGVDRDQSYLAPDHMMTSVMRYVDQVAYQLARDLLKNEFTPGTHNMGVADNAVGLAPLNKALVTDPKLIAELDEQTKLLAERKIKVPSTKQEYIQYGYPARKAT